jgi:hypothetical protein
MKITLFLLVLVVLTQAGCWVTAQEGTVQVRTINDKIDLIIRPESGGVYSYNVWWDEYYPVSLQAKTSEVDVTASSKDNAALTLKVAVTYHTQNTDQSIEGYLRKFGLDAKDRDGRFNPILAGQVNTETKNALAEFDAYGILANQEAIQQRLQDKLKPIFATQMYLDLESVQIIGRPDFLDDRIEQAASQVVANQKLKEAAQAGLEAARVDAERKQVEAATYANPALLQIRKLELQREIAAEWRQHNGTLVFGGASPMLNLQEK